MSGQELFENFKYSKPVMVNILGSIPMGVAAGATAFGAPDVDKTVATALVIGHTLHGAARSMVNLALLPFALAIDLCRNSFYVYNELEARHYTYKYDPETYSLYSDSDSDTYEVKTVISPTYSLKSNSSQTLSPLSSPARSVHDSSKLPSAKSPASPWERIVTSRDNNGQFNLNSPKHNM